MKDRSANRLLIITVLALAIGGASLAVQGPLLGDDGATRTLQSLFGDAPRWAGWLTDTAKPPMVIATMGVGAGLAWLAAGWRSALSVPLAFALAWLIDKGLRAVIFAPRPSPDLVAVASASSSSGLPSTFGLVYGSIFGVVVFAAATGRSAIVLRALALALTLAGAAARVVLGGHWTSQMVASVLLGLLAAAAASAVVYRLLMKEVAR
ncbi:phosphatase PAP2 family protein [Erythrobacter sp. W302b]|uniref:phosphatase PAP2 family protein n=1 Tax=Erythrobacter sp. W302b TaxID=3389874 RepID=UPI00396AFD17